MNRKLKRSADLFQVLATMAFAGLVRDRAAIASLAAADILAFQSDHFYRLPAPALAWVTFAALATAIAATSAENARALLDG